MKILADKNILMENISIVSKAVSSKSTLEILNCILLVATEDGLKMIGNNLELGIESKNIEANVISPGSVALDARLFSDIIRRLPSQTVDITVDEKNVAYIKCGKSDFKIIGYSGDEFPYLEEVNTENPLLIKSETFKEMIKSTIFAVSTNESKPIMTGELFISDDESYTMVAVDGFRVSLLSIERDKDLGYSNETRVVIPGSSLAEIAKIIGQEDEEVISLYTGKNYCMIENEYCRIVTRIIDGDFIKYDNLFASEYTTEVTINRREFLDSLERASLLSMKDLKKSPIKIEIDSEEMQISAVSDIGTTHESVYIIMDGKNITIAFNPKYIIDALKIMEEDDVRLRLLTPLSPCIMTGVGNDRYKYLVLPLRIKE